MATHMLSFSEMERRREAGGYEDMATLTSSNLNQGEQIEVLDSYGKATRYTIVNSRTGFNEGLPNLTEVIARAETGEHEGRSVVLDSSMSDCFDVGWKRTPINLQSMDKPPRYPQHAALSGHQKP